MDFDLFVIGGGSGGVRAARVAAAEGKKVGLAEESRLGGTCVIRGCVPKKLMVFASKYTEYMDDAAAYGWDVIKGGFDWPAFQTRLHGELNRLEGVYGRLLENSGVQVYDSRATVDGPHTVCLADGQIVTARIILVATGGWPSMPDVPGRELAITSNDIFDLPTLPKKMLIVGGGYIACEFAGVLNGLGVETHLWYRGDQVLRGFDDEARGVIADGMIAKGVHLTTGANVASLVQGDGVITVIDTAGVPHDFDQVMYATGRSPNSAGLGLQALGVALDHSGAVQVDSYSQTAVPSIYAIGDVTNRVNLTPVAIREGMAFVDTVFNGKPTKV
ncbi:MAG: FAD-dependent oxidoreductase, partial [Pseudomonadota bacterium]